MDIEEIFEISSSFTSSMSTSEPNLQTDILTKYLQDRLCTKNKISQDFKTGLDWINVNKALLFQGELKGKLVVLDFFTYCCINCMHILPQLKNLENKFSVEDGLVVIGVHSPKFANERATENVRAAVRRYEISHPVVNDHTEHLWNALGICCWPTLVIVGPGSELLLYLMGESHEQLLYAFVNEALTMLNAKNLISHHPIPGMGVEHELVERQQLYFPGKICAIETPKHLQLAVSDSGHHRVIVLDGDGLVKWIIGGPQSGFEDGSFEVAKFHSPQGLVFSCPTTLFVTDTENHALRKVDFKTRTVSTVAGDGRQGDDLVGGGIGTNQRLSSPWDVLAFSDSVLMIAMAGCHQIWAYFINDTTFWKNKVYAAGACAAVVGSGREENRNNAYPRSAGLAQPSGLALDPEAGRLFVADSESSTVRDVYLADGKVAALVGGQADPQNLFAFGDKDGCGLEARLQHPLAVAWSNEKGRLYVCDTYNHKIKVVDPTSRYCCTLKLLNNTNPLNEPGGLCVVGNLLYVADTNNHCIKIINLDDNSLKTMPVSFQPKTSKIGHSDPVGLAETLINKKGGVLKLSISLHIPSEVKLLPDSPVQWTLDFPSGWKELESSGAEVNRNWTLEVEAGSVNKKDVLKLHCRLLFCHEGLCSKRELPFHITVLFSDAAPNEATCHVEHQISIGGS